MSGSESEPRYFGPAAVLTIRVIKQTVYLFCFFSPPPQPPPLPEELCSKTPEEKTQEEKRHEEAESDHGKQVRAPVGGEGLTCLV